MVKDVPVYESKHYKYVRESDFEGYMALELKQFAKNLVRPLIQGEKGTINDAVFYEDYLEFLEYLKGKKVKIAS